MQSLMLALSGILLLGSTGAFFLYVSILSIMAVAVILMALMLMFLLGVQAARQGISIPAIAWGRKLGLVQALGAPSEVGHVRDHLGKSTESA
jgi:hypothetical protein